VSTTGLDAFRFFPDPVKRSISTTWAVAVNGTISWTNSQFPAGHANFCLSGSSIWIYFSQRPTLDCVPVSLGAIPKANVIPPGPSTSVSKSEGETTASSLSPSQTPGGPKTIYGSLATAAPVGCLSSPLGALALNSPNYTVGNLEQCLDLCADFISSGTDYHYIGAQFGKSASLRRTVEADSV
jgi:hypothetical protein